MSDNEEAAAPGRGLYTEGSLPPLFAYLWRRASHIALQHGYACALHGSLGRDVDIVCVAWTDEARPAAELAGALAAVFVDHDYQVHGPEKKPHGRMAWTFHPFGSGPGYMDVSIIGPRDEAWCPDCGAALTESEDGDPLLRGMRQILGGKLSGGRRGETR